MDTLEKALELFEKEQKEFEGHWIWKSIGKTPNDFFKMVNAAKSSLSISTDQWEKMFQEKKRQYQIQAMERKRIFNPINLRMLNHILV
jgi:hypothetical protein